MEGKKRRDLGWPRGVIDSKYEFEARNRSLGRNMHAFRCPKLLHRVELQFRKSIRQWEIGDSASIPGGISHRPLSGLLDLGNRRLGKSQHLEVLVEGGHTNHDWPCWPQGASKHRPETNPNYSVAATAHRWRESETTRGSPCRCHSLGLA